MYYCGICNQKFKRINRRNKHMGHHNRQKQYTHILSSVKHNRTDIVFKENGKLIFCLIEFRTMKEIEYVINCILKVYDPSEIGFAIVYGNGNKDYIESITKDMTNVLHIKLDFNNISIKKYNKILRWKHFYDKFVNWEYMLLIQTDALIVRKIDEIYFDYDYIGAPWSSLRPGGNGGFSLRKIDKFIDITKENNIISKINGSVNEDIFFSTQGNMKYCKDMKIHRQFSVEELFCPDPIGFHKVYNNHQILHHQWNHIINYIKQQLL